MGQKGRRGDRPLGCLQRCGETRVQAGTIGPGVARRRMKGSRRAKGGGSLSEDIRANDFTAFLNRSWFKFGIRVTFARRSVSNVQALFLA